MEMRNSYEIWDMAERKSASFVELSNRVWATPELGFKERVSSSAHIALLEGEGFRIESRIAGIETAFFAEAGTGGPVIAILGEFDALPGLSQVAGVAEPLPLVTSGNGHGCGHNMLGAGSLLAAASLKDWLEANDVKGRVRYYGCPAEESGSGKSFLVRSGCFDDVDIAISWHPAAFTGVNPPMSLACIEMEFAFTGRSAHAAVSPHLGRSALDAMELMHVGINYLREHMPQGARVHYAVMDGGGKAPNVVQSHAGNRLLIRSRDLSDLWKLVDRVRKIAEGAALMTETTVQEKLLAGEANLVGNKVLEQTMDRVITQLGPPVFDDADKTFAKEIQSTLSPSDITASYRRYGVTPKKDEVLSDETFPLGAGAVDSIGSTDVGTVTWIAPTVQCRVACYAIGTPGHSWQLVAQGQAPAAHKGLVHAAKIMATTASELFSNDGLLEQARKEHQAFRATNDFANPIGDDVQLDEDMAVR
jgi:aminobenzoyl-glutamate utilization protein B